MLDGTVPVPDPQKLFGTNRDPTTVTALLTEDDLPTAAAKFTFITVSVNTGESLIFFDTGNGEATRPARGHLAAQTEIAGYSADQ